MINFRQSPININDNNKLSIGIDESFIELGLFDKNIKSVPEFKNNNIIFNVKNNIITKFNGIQFTLKQFHFHNPSEHKVNNKKYPMEVHFVHTFEDQILVIGLFIKDSNKFGPLDNAISIKNKENEEKEIVINVPKKYCNTFYYYPGSLTTPPYSNNVSWIIMTNPIESKCIDQWNNSYGKARKIQKSCCSEVLKFNFN
jgi:carbonic anhydrase